jgi:hypothetical protein
MEVWRDLAYYENDYEINQSGVIRNKHTKIIKKTTRKDNGYLICSFWIDGKTKQEYVHRLVALTFIPNPDNLPQVNHKDENKENNSVGNLEWCTSQYNNTYGTARQRSVATQMRNGSYERARDRWIHNNPAKVNPKNRANNSYAKRVRCGGHIFDCIKDCAEYYGVNYSTMRCWLSGAYNMPKYFSDNSLQYIFD